jgi:hypothetical protein
MLGITRRQKDRTAQVEALLRSVAVDSAADQGPEGLAACALDRWQSSRARSLSRRRSALCAAAAAAALVTAVGLALHRAGRGLSEAHLSRIARHLDAGARKSDSGESGTVHRKGEDVRSRKERDLPLISKGAPALEDSTFPFVPSSLPYSRGDKGGPRYQLRQSGNDLADMNDGSVAAPPRWTSLPQDERESIEARVRRNVRVRDDFVQIPFPRLASASDRQIAQAVESYKREAAIVDARLSREVTLQFKATALSDLCDRLRSDTGIRLEAGRSVADEKVTLFCRKTPLREVMRQLSRPFGYSWVRSQKDSEYRYELLQDLRSQLLEEELRNRDRNEALLSLEREIEKYRRYLHLSPDEALARARTAAPEDKKVLENLSGMGWGALQMYFRLSPREQAALRAGQTLTFSALPKPDEQPLPSDVARGVLQSIRDWRVLKYENGIGTTQDLNDPKGLPLSAVPEMRAQIVLEMPQSEIGQFTLIGRSGFVLSPTRFIDWMEHRVRLAMGMSPTALEADSRATHAQLARDPAFRSRVSIQPQSHCSSHQFSGADRQETFSTESRPADPREAGDADSRTEPVVTTADVLEALHHATGQPVVADYYTRLYRQAAVTLKNQSLFEALNQLCDTMRLRWNKELSRSEGLVVTPAARRATGREPGPYGDKVWLQFRSISYYNDRLKEVPNRLLNRWAAARRQQGMLALDDLVEIAQLPDAQLDGAEMAQGARDCYGLLEWEFPRYVRLRPQLRYLATFTPAQRQETIRPEGLPFARMSLAQQQQYITQAIYSYDAPLQSLEELTGATLRVHYTQPGWFQWGNYGALDWRRYVLAPEPGRRIPRPLVLGRTREAALQAAHRFDPGADGLQIVPTELHLAVVYVPGISNRRNLRIYDPNHMVYISTP